MQQTKDLSLTHKKNLTTPSTCGWYNYGVREISRLYIKFWVQFWDFEQQEKLKEL